MAIRNAIKYFILKALIRYYLRVFRDIREHLKKRDIARKKMNSHDVLKSRKIRKSIHIVKIELFACKNFVEMESNS